MELEEKVDKLMIDISEIKTALTYDGTGLIPSFEKHCISDEKFRGDYYKFKRWVIGIACFLAGSGVLGVSIFEVLK